MNKKKELSALRKGKAEERIATALEHIAFYLGEIVNSKIKQS